MGSYISVKNDIYDAEFVMMKYSANGTALAWTAAVGGAIAIIGTAGVASGAIAGVGAAAAGAATIGAAGFAASQYKNLEAEFTKKGYHKVAKGSSYKSEKLTLSLVCQIDVIVVKEKSGYIRKYRGSMTTWSGATDKSCKYYNASDVSLSEF